MAPLHDEQEFFPSLLSSVDARDKYHCWANADPNNKGVFSPTTAGESIVVSTLPQSPSLESPKGTSGRSCTAVMEDFSI